MTDRQPPPQEVLAAFELTGETPLTIDGGQQESWRVGDFVLKPTRNISLSQWLSEILNKTHGREAQCTQPFFRVAKPIPVRGRDNEFVFQEWTAAAFIQGVPDNDLEPRLAEIVQASRAMHQVLRDIVPEPQARAMLSNRADRWAYADYFAWDEITVSEIPNINLDFFKHELEPYLSRLELLKHPLQGSLEHQLVHGDLAGNILFVNTSMQNNLPPGILDFDPYWRPVEYAEAILIADGLTWQGFGPEQVKSIGWSDFRFQMLLRALIFRIVQYAIYYDEGFVQRNWRNIKVESAVKLLETIC